MRVFGLESEYNDSRSAVTFKRFSLLSSSLSVVYNVFNFWPFGFRHIFITRVKFVIYIIYPVNFLHVKGNNLCSESLQNTTVTGQQQQWDTAYTVIARAAMSEILCGVKRKRNPVSTAVNTRIKKQYKTTG